MSTGRILYYSNNIDSYVDVIAAMSQQYRTKKIELAFIFLDGSSDIPNIGKAQSDTISEIYKLLKSLGQHFPAYRIAESIEIVPMSFSDENVDKIIQGSDIIDVTTTPKKLSVQIVAGSIQTGKKRICALHWLSKFEKNKRFRIGRDAYDYVDLTRLERTASLRRSHASRASLLLSMGAAICAVSVLSFISKWHPNLAVANEALLAISVAAGFAGLYIAVKGDKVD